MYINTQNICTSGSFVAEMLLIVAWTFPSIESSLHLLPQSVWATLGSLHTSQPTLAGEVILIYKENATLHKTLEKLE